MSRILILGATGSLGRHVLRQALAVGHEVTVFVRTPSRLPAEVQGRVSVHTGDLRSPVPRDLIEGHEALINCAGHVADGDAFVGLIDRLVTAVDSLPLTEQPVCWFLGGAALLDLDSSGRRGVELPRGEVHLLAPPGQLRAADPLASGLAIALPRTDGRRGRDRTGPAAHLSRRSAGSRSDIRPRSAGPALPADLRIPDSADDRPLRGCGGPHARQRRSRSRLVPAPHRAGASRGHARAEIGMVGQHQSGSPITR